MYSANIYLENSYHLQTMAHKYDAIPKIQEYCLFKNLLCICAYQMLFDQNVFWGRS